MVLLLGQYSTVSIYMFFFLSYQDGEGFDMFALRVKLRLFDTCWIKNILASTLVWSLPQTVF